MLTEELIRAKRDGAVLDPADIRAYVEGVTSGDVSDAQIAAFGMAVFFRGMTPPETAALTLAMRDSGTVMRWADGELPGPPLDKHSTGGVGDKVSLMLAPIIAACGGAVPMISGRGLGHGQGTVDKLESIPGYRTDPDEATFRRVVREVGCAIIGQTPQLAPADKRIYAVRDVTGTVESLPLITGSILSKKLAAGLSGLVMDVTFGSGAFMSTVEPARELARAIVDVATAAGCPTVALLTDMNEVLGRAGGHAVEVAEAIAYLRGDDREPRLHAVTAGLAAELLVIGGLAADVEAGLAMVERALTSGEAVERFARMVAALGGPADLVDRPATYLAAAPVVVPVRAGASGVVRAVDTRRIGLTIVELGGGWSQPGVPLDHAVGVTDVQPIGTPVTAGDAVMRLHARDRATGEAAAAAIAAGIEIGEAPTPRPVILERVVAAA
ncbi:MAG: thymidine phosphorylase [Chloroflexota bacterium]